VSFRLPDAAYCAAAPCGKDTHRIKTSGSLMTVGVERSSL
jgi:hypothetical protein